MCLSPLPAVVTGSLMKRRPEGRSILTISARRAGVWVKEWGGRRPHSTTSTEDSSWGTERDIPIRVWCLCIDVCVIEEDGVFMWLSSSIHSLFSSLSAFSSETCPLSPTRPLSRSTSGCITSGAVPPCHTTITALSTNTESDTSSITVSSSSTLSRYPECALIRIVLFLGFNWSIFLWDERKQVHDHSAHLPGEGQPPSHCLALGETPR